MKGNLQLGDVCLFMRVSAYAEILMIKGDVSKVFILAVIYHIGMTRPLNMVV